MSSPWSWRADRPACARQAAGLIRLEGEDSRRFLHGQTSAAIEAALPGQWIPTCCISPTARLRALADVLVDDTGAWLAVTAGDAQQVREALDRVLFPADRVQLGPVLPAWLLTAVAGREETLPASQAGSWEALPEGQGWQLGSGPLGMALLLRAAEPGPPGRLPGAWSERTPLNSLEQERWRIQLGLPAAPGELNEDHNPFELGLAARVSLSKGCYVGQETLARLATYDGVKQQLRRWHWSRSAGQAPPLAGQELGLAPEHGSGGQKNRPDRLGRISSLLELENGDRIGLALVRRQALGLAQLRAGEGAAAATITLSEPDLFREPPLTGRAQDS
jgi:folate-binding protein YgfZ